MFAIASGPVRAVDRGAWPSVVLVAGAVHPQPPPRLDQGLRDPHDFADDLRVRRPRFRFNRGVSLANTHASQRFAARLTINPSLARAT